jgi:hypothetical protein
MNENSTTQETNDAARVSETTWFTDIICFIPLPFYPSIRPSVLNLSVRITR